jgi:hypothetical protein
MHRIQVLAYTIVIKPRDEQGIAEFPSEDRPHSIDLSYYYGCRSYKKKGIQKYHICFMLDMHLIFLPYVGTPSAEESEEDSRKLSILSAGDWSQSRICLCLHSPDIVMPHVSQNVQ